MAGDSCRDSEGYWWMAAIVLAIVVLLVLVELNEPEDNGPIRNRIVEIEYE